MGIRPKSLLGGRDTCDNPTAGQGVPDILVEWQGSQSGCSEHVRGAEVGLGLYRVQTV